MTPRIAIVALTAVIAVAFCTTIQAKTLKVTSVTASASLTQEGYTFQAESLTDDRLYTFWVAGGQGGGLSDNVKVTFEGNKTVTGMEIWNGCQVDQDSYNARGRVAKMALKIGFAEEVVDVADTYGKQVIRFEQSYSANNIRIFFKGLHHGNSWDQIAISEIRFLDDSPDTYVTNATASASSVLEGDDYVAANLVDGFVDSMWCEGVKGTGEEDSEDKKRGQPEAAQTSMNATRNFTEAGGGIGEWVKVDLGGRRSVSRVGIVIGDAYDQQSFSYSSRPARLSVRFSDGSSETWNLDDTPDWQYLDVGGRDVSWAKFTIDEVSLGRRYNDTSIGEIRFWTD